MKERRTSICLSDVELGDLTITHVRPDDGFGTERGSEIVERHTSEAWGEKARKHYRNITIPLENGYHLVIEHHFFRGEG